MGLFGKQAKRDPRAEREAAWGEYVATFELSPVFEMGLLSIDWTAQPAAKVMPKLLSMLDDLQRGGSPEYTFKDSQGKPFTAPWFSLAGEYYGIVIGLLILVCGDSRGMFLHLKELVQAYQSGEWPTEPGKRYPEKEMQAMYVLIISGLGAQAALRDTGISKDHLSELYKRSPDSMKVNGSYDMGTTLMRNFSVLGAALHPVLERKDWKVFFLLLAELLETDFEVDPPMPAEEEKELFD